MRHLHSILESSLLECLGKREGGDTGSSTALCNYCGSCCIVTIFDRLWHRWIWPQRLKTQVKGLTKSRAKTALRWRERREKGAFGRVIKLVCLFCKHLCSKKLLQDGLHQLGRTFFISYVNNNKVTLPSWNLVANVITNGICSGWVFLTAHIWCSLKWHSFGYKQRIRDLICHVLNLSVGPIVRLVPYSHVIPSNRHPGGFIQSSR